MRVFVEIGLNHLGSPKIAINLLKKCIKMNIDGITLQIQPENYYDNSKNFRKKLNLKTYMEFARILKKRKKLFGLAIVDQDTLEKFKFLKPDFIKILSLSFNNKKLINAAFKSVRELFVSTGVANFTSIKKMSKKYGKINFIHTTLDDQPKTANTLAIKKIQEKVKNKVSFGLHSSNINVLYGAIALQPESIFFYIKPDKLANYPDNKHAVPIIELPNVLKTIKIVEQSLGDGSKAKKEIPDWVYE